VTGAVAEQQTWVDTHAVHDEANADQQGDVPTGAQR
jgi:hypothetical protein